MTGGMRIGVCGKGKRAAAWRRGWDALKRTPTTLTRTSTTLLLLLVVGSASAQTLHMPPHEKYVLKNGLTVLLLEKHGVPMINVFALLKTGSAADPAGQSGLASVTAGLLRKGTKGRTAQQFASDLDYIGGEFEAEAGADFSSVATEFLTKDLERGLGLFSDALLHPTFPQAEVDKLLAQSVDAVRGAKDDPQQVLGPYYDGYLYGTHPYGRPAGGDEASLQRIKRDAIVKFYEGNYAPGNALLAVAGELNGGEMRKKLEDVFGAWTAHTVAAPSVVPAAPGKGKRMLLVDKGVGTQTDYTFWKIWI